MHLMVTRQQVVDQWLLAPAAAGDSKIVAAVFEGEHDLVAEGFFMFRSLRAQLGVIFFGFLMLVVATVTTAFLAFRAQANDAAAINLARRQRLLAEQIVMLALTQPDSLELPQAVQVFEQNLYALRDGGMGLESTGHTVALPPAPNPDLRVRLDAAFQMWTDFRAYLQPVEAAALEAESVRLLAQLDATVSEFEARAQSKLAALQRAQLFFLAAALLLLAWGYRVTRHFPTQLAGPAAMAPENARLDERAERVAVLEERRRIGAEMHDGLAQTLTYLDHRAEQVAAAIETGRIAQALADLHQTREVLRQTAQQVRRTIASLDEAPPQWQSLHDWLAHLVAQLPRDGGPPVELIDSIQLPLFVPHGVTEQVLRIVREAVLNAQHHAQAEHIRVQVERQEVEASVTVEDDGHGFDPQSPSMNGGGHFGLRIMRARAARIGGTLALHSTPGQGTRVVLSWPMDGPLEDE